MKRLLVFLVLAGGGWFAWQRAGGGTTSGAEKTLDQLLGFWAQGRTDYALPLTEGSQVKQMLEDRSVRHVMSPIVMQTIHKSSVKVLSSAKSGDETTLEVEQTIGYDPPGVESAMRSAMTVSFKHKATLKRVGEDWKVTRLEIGAPVGLWGK